MAAKTNKQHPKQPTFQKYWSREAVEEGLRLGHVIQGSIRVNPKNFEESFVLHPRGDADVLLKGLPARNRALNDDEVAVKIEPIKDWLLTQSDGQGEEAKSNRMTVALAVGADPEALSALFPGASSPVDVNSCLDPPGCSDLFRKVIRTGRVVSIIQALHHRVAVGTIKQMAKPEKNPKKRMIFAPIDRRVPRMILDENDYPPQLFLRPHEFAKSHFIARITDWREDSVYANGRIVRLIGEAGDFNVEQQALLITHGIAEKDFAPDVLACIDDSRPDDAEMSRRRDLRDLCVFTIDPETARDLDDALHIRELDSGRVEIGVHIADVSFYVRENTPLDAEAMRRGNSVYLVDEVIPMLPRGLCEHLCSLNPGEEKLTMSVIWQMDREGQVLDTWFGRTVIRSCVKLSYDIAQDFIDNPQKEDWPGLEIHGPWTVPEVKASVLRLTKITRAMCGRRFVNGALRLSSAKLGFVFSSPNGPPCGVTREVMKMSMSVVEELMLLANISVATQLYQGLPDEAFLRRHPPPSTRALAEVQDVCQALGVPLNVDSSQDIQESLETCVAEVGPDGEQVLVNLLSKPMQLARYFCAGQMARSKAEARAVFSHHYALNVPLYTHFTSPIRRYPDIIVHRQLMAILLGKETSIVEGPNQRGFDSIAQSCNLRKKNAKLASESSRDLYLRAFVCSVEKLEEDAVVLGVLDRSFDVLLLNIGIIKRVYTDQMETLDTPVFTPLADAKGAASLTLHFKDKTVQEVRPMSHVKVVLMKSSKEKLKFDVLLVPAPTG